MKTAVAAAMLLAFGLAIPQAGHAQSSGPGINIPVPKWMGQSNGREQQAQLRDQDRYCADLRNRADEARYDADRARYRDEATRAEDRLRDIQSRLSRECNYY
jgi:hypothetical protein